MFINDIAGGEKDRTHTSNSSDGEINIYLSFFFSLQFFGLYTLVIFMCAFDCDRKWTRRKKKKKREKSSHKTYEWSDDDHWQSGLCVF